jgi:hypothetical protein
VDKGKHNRNEVASFCACLMVLSCVFESQSLKKRERLWLGLISDGRVKQTRAGVADSGHCYSGAAWAMRALEEQKDDIAPAFKYQNPNAWSRAMPDSVYENVH